jgi:hypothetical protein
MAALDGTSSTRLLTSQTTHENPSSNKDKAVREFVVVLLLTPGRDERRRRCEAMRHGEGNQTSKLYRDYRKMGDVYSFKISTRSIGL